VEQWPAIKSAVDLISKYAPTHDEVMSGALPKAGDGGLEMALGQAAAMIERMRESIRRAIDAWDNTTNSKSHDGRMWQCMEELRQEIGNGESGGDG